MTVEFRSVSDEEAAHTLCFLLPSPAPSTPTTTPTTEQWSALQLLSHLSSFSEHQLRALALAGYESYSTETTNSSASASSPPLKTGGCGASTRFDQSFLTLANLVSNDSQDLGQQRAVGGSGVGNDFDGARRFQILVDTASNLTTGERNGSSEDHGNHANRANHPKTLNDAVGSGLNEQGLKSLLWNSSRFQAKGDGVNGDHCAAEGKGDNVYRLIASREEQGEGKASFLSKEKLTFVLNSLEGFPLNRKRSISLGMMESRKVPRRGSTFSMSFSEPPKMIGIYNPEERKKLIDRYMEKRKRRNWRKKIKYSVRKTFADSRLRVKGRFVSKGDEGKIREGLLLAF